MYQEDSAKIVSAEEELQAMTFQVALVGDSGIVIGSDRLVINKKQEGTYAKPSYQFTEADKFCMNETLACFYAGSPTSKELATKIYSKFHQELPALESWEDSMNEFLAQQKTQSVESTFDEVLVFRADVIDKGWIVTRSPKGMPRLADFSDRLCTGDVSPARFISWKLYKKSSNEYLSKLAFLTLCFATEYSPSTVGRGFDIISLGSDHKFSHCRFPEGVVGHGIHKKFSNALDRVFGRLQIDLDGLLKAHGNRNETTA